MSESISMLSIMNIGSFMGGKNKVSFFQVNKQLYTRFKREHLDYILDSLKKIDLLEKQRLMLDLWNDDHEFQPGFDFFTYHTNNYESFYDLLSIMERKIDNEFFEMLGITIDKMLLSYIELYRDCKDGKKDIVFDYDLMRMNPRSLIEN